jgi:two-component system, sensor histidine kinase and response regulator
MTFSSELAKLDCAVALERLGGDAELLREVAGLFLEEYPMLMDEIHAAMVSGDGESLQRAAHSMKGAVSNFGAEDVYEAAFALEKMGRAGDFTTMENSIRCLADALENIRPALELLAHS